MSNDRPSVTTPTSAKGAASGGLLDADIAAQNVERKKMERSIVKVQEAIDNGLFSADQILARLGVQAQSKLKKIHNLASGEFEFRLERIAPEDVECKTKISMLNPRHHDILTAVDVMDIIETLDGGTQEHIAYAFIDEDGIMWVVDGGRRRLANINCKNPPPFDVWVTDKQFTEEDVFQLDRILDAKKGRTASEQGEHWQKVKDRRGFKNNKELADYLRVPLSTVTLNIRLAKVRKHIRGLAIVPSILGEKNIKRLEVFDQGLDDDEFEALKKIRDDELAKNEHLYRVKPLKTQDELDLESNDDDDSDEQSDIEFDWVSPQIANSRMIAFLEKALKEICGQDSDGDDDKADFEPIVPLKRRGAVVQVKEVRKNDVTTINFKLKGLAKKVGDPLRKEIEELIANRMKENNLVK